MDIVSLSTGMDCERRSVVETSCAEDTDNTDNNDDDDNEDECVCKLLTLLSLHENEQIYCIHFNSLSSPTTNCSYAKRTQIYYHPGILQSREGEKGQIQEYNL